jgi:hypothetical protein
MLTGSGEFVRGVESDALIATCNERDEFPRHVVG